jgi:polyhydroxyalkanoate synthesis regulator phasin
MMKSKYTKELTYIEETLVPNSGQADSLQGELLRQLWKLVDEAQRNGNMNWDEDFEYFTEFLKEKLVESDAVGEAKKAELAEILDKIKEAGQYAKKFNDGEIGDD